jgi:hypothetical protein
MENISNRSATVRERLSISLFFLTAAVNLEASYE